MVKSLRLVRTTRRRRAETVRDLVRRAAETGRRAGHRLVAQLNAAVDYGTFCAAELARLPRDLRSRTTQEMQRPESAWRKTYRSIKVVEAMLLDSLDLLAAGQLTTGAMRRFNAYQEQEQPLAPMLGQADREYGGAIALSVSERIIPDAPAVAQLLPRDGGEPIANFWGVIAARALNRLKQCQQCHRWFVDESKNRTGTRCSTECTNKWWSRERRRAAHHGRGRKRR